MSDQRAFEVLADWYNKMKIKEMIKAGANVQLVVSVSDLKELFNEWQNEREAMKPAKEDVLRTADEAAAQLNVSGVTLWRWGKEGYLMPVKAGRKVYYWQSAIDGLLNKKEA